MTTTGEELAERAALEAEREVYARATWPAHEIGVTLSSVHALMTALADSRAAEREVQDALKGREAEAARVVREAVIEIVSLALRTSEDWVRVTDSQGWICGTASSAMGWAVGRPHTYGERRRLWPTTAAEAVEQLRELRDWLADQARRAPAPHRLRREAALITKEAEAIRRAVARTNKARTAAPKGV